MRKRNGAMNVVKQFLICALSLCICLSLYGCKSKEAAQVDKLIADIGEVSLDNEEQIVEAESLYESLTDKQKDEVTNLGMLKQARETYDQLRAEAVEASSIKNAEIKSWRFVVDQNSNPLLILTYSWTNEGSATVNSASEIVVKAFQNGVSLDTGKSPFDETIDLLGEERDVKVGSTVEINKAFSVANRENDIEIEITRVNETSQYAEPLSCTIPITDCVLTYPLRSTSKYLSEAEPIPDIIWTTLGSENGLGGHIYSFTGTVKEYLNKDEYAGNTYFIVSTDKGEVLVADVYHATEELAMKQGQMDVFRQCYVEENGDYSLPPVGETAHFICTYSGFSQKLNMPAFHFGANEMLVEVEREQR